MSDTIRILLVDDDENFYVLTRELLAGIPGNRYEVDWAGSYDTALGILEVDEHAVWLVDYRLGVHDGLELMREALNRGNKAPMILMTGQNWIDPALSFGIGAMILWSSFGIIRETLNILLEGTPHGIDPRVLTADLKTIAGVNDIHDLHIWSIGSGVNALSCHISIADIPPSESEVILRNVQERLRAQFHIDHTTIQFEHAECEVAHGCVIPIEGHRHKHGH